MIHAVLGILAKVIVVGLLSRRGLRILWFEKVFISSENMFVTCRYCSVER